MSCSKHIHTPRISCLSRPPALIPVILSFAASLASCASSLLVALLPSFERPVAFVAVWTESVTDVPGFNRYHLPARSCYPTYCEIRYRCRFHLLRLLLLRLLLRLPAPSGTHCIRSRVPRDLHHLKCKLRSSCFLFSRSTELHSLARRRDSDA